MAGAPGDFSPLSAADAQKMADRAALVGILRPPVAAAADIATLPGRAMLGIGNTLTRGVNALLPQGINIPMVPESAFGGNSRSMTPYFDALPKAPITPLLASPADSMRGPNTAGAANEPSAMPASAPAPAVPAPTADNNMRPSVLATPATPLLDPRSAADAGVAAHLSYVQQVLPILLQAAASYGDPRNAGGHLDSLMHAFGNMDLARDISSGVNTINSGRLANQGTALHGLTSLGVAGLQGQTQLELERRRPQQTGAEPVFIPGTGVMTGSTPTFSFVEDTGQGMTTRPVGPYAQRQAAASKRIPGYTYTDSQGNSAVYNADGTYSPVKK